MMLSKARVTPAPKRWAVFISADGNQLSTHMTYDPDDDVEEKTLLQAIRKATQQKI